MVNIEELKKCKTFSGVGKLLGYKYHNGRVKQEIVDYCNELGIDIITVVEENKKKYCPQCGVLVTKKGNRFCSSSCSATFNNKIRTPMTEKTKNKIRNTLIRNFENENPNDIRKRINGKLKYKHVCITCGNIFYSQLESIRFCSQKCSASNEEVREILSKKHKLLFKKGITKGWATRNIRSYPEKFWIKVLNNNKIEFVSESKVGKYFLDFYIEINGRKIDLEIDGSQHLREDRKESDRKRDVYLRKEGYEVYRIEWNEINSEGGKLKMKEKINNFLKYYNK